MIRGVLVIFLIVGPEVYVGAADAKQLCSPHSDVGKLFSSRFVAKADETSVEVRKKRENWEVFRACMVVQGGTKNIPKGGNTEQKLPTPADLCHWLEEVTARKTALEEQQKVMLGMQQCLRAAKAKKEVSWLVWIAENTVLFWSLVGLLAMLLGLAGVVVLRRKCPTKGARGRSSRSNRSSRSSRSSRPSSSGHHDEEIVASSTPTWGNFRYMKDNTYANIDYNSKKNKKKTKKDADARLRERRLSHVRLSRISGTSAATSSPTSRDAEDDGKAPYEDEGEAYHEDEGAATPAEQKEERRAKEHARRVEFMGHSRARDNVPSPVDEFGFYRGPRFAAGSK